MENSEDLKAAIEKIKEYEESKGDQDIEIRGEYNALGNFRIQLEEVKCNKPFDEDGRTEEELSCMEALLDDIIKRCDFSIKSITDKAAESAGESQGLEKAISIIESMGETKESEEGD